jgi:hypothetical protein
MRGKPLYTKPFFEFRKKQYENAKIEALRLWKRLEKLHLGLKVLDEAIDVNFRQERIIYKKMLDRMIEDGDPEDRS